MKQQENNLGRIWFEFYPFTMTGSTYYNAQSHEIQKKKTQKRIMVIAWPDTMIYYFVVVKFDPSPPHVQRAWCEPSIAECSEVIIFYASATPLQLWILMIILKVQRAVYFIECTHSLLWLFKYIGIIFQFELLLLQCSNKCEAFCMLQQSTQYAMQCTH